MHSNQTNRHRPNRRGALPRLTQASMMELPMRSKRPSNNPNASEQHQPSMFSPMAFAYRPKPPPGEADQSVPTGPRRILAPPPNHPPSHRSHDQPPTTTRPSNPPNPPPTQRHRRPIITPAFMHHLRTTLHATRSLTQHPLPTPSQINEIIRPPFNPLFDEIHPDNPLYKTARTCPYPCTASQIDWDSVTGLPPRNLSADVKIVYPCGHERNYSTRCDIFFFYPEELFDIEFPRATLQLEGRQRKKQTEYAPHRPPHKITLHELHPCTACTARRIARLARDDLDSHRRRLKLAKRLGWSRERVREIRAAVESGEYEVKIEKAIAEGLVAGEVEAEVEVEEETRVERERRIDEAEDAELAWEMDVKGNVQ